MIDENGEPKADPREFILLYKGEIQRLAYSAMSGAARAAERELKGHQYAIATIFGEGPADNDYRDTYLAVQNQATLVQRLYREIDQAYAQAANADEFDEVCLTGYL